MRFIFVTQHIIIAIFVSTVREIKIIVVIAKVESRLINQYGALLTRSAIATCCASFIDTSAAA